jgi:hypothetical protein
LQGVATGGNINIDGVSSVRRSCTLTLVTSIDDPVKIHDVFWSLSTEFKVFLGLKNSVDNTYPDIIWFPMGHYLISSFTYS